MGSPNVLKVAIMLEELGLDYRFHHLDVLLGGSATPEFLAMNPLGKVPVIVDHEGAPGQQPIFESGAILIYLAETYKSDLLPPAPARWDVIKWLIAQVALAGPMLGQLNHFQLVAKQLDSYAGRRYRDQAGRVYRDFDTRLGVAPWLGGSDYSIADIAMYPWAGYFSRHGFAAEDYPNLIAWREKIDQRPAVQRAAALLASKSEKEMAARRVAKPEDYDRFFGRSKAGDVQVDMDGYLAQGSFTSAKT
ncbi:hypothetical protein A0J57_04160 [Sphingobium sp. 22B]|nr:hypothetical protein AXW74_00710 [Sphingobium sp. AM]KYC33784.1 hypothetical protein A0J57_04160 [Sphingobium sp. 22B]OAP33520.1 hypothetical protein A8O16_03380 [Sphingobium sp. 20006FA]